MPNPTVAGRVQSRLTTVFHAFPSAGENAALSELRSILPVLADLAKTFDGNSLAVGPLEDVDEIDTDLTDGVLCWRGSMSQDSLLKNPLGVPRPLATVTWRIKQGVGGGWALSLDTQFRVADGVVIDTSAQAEGDAAYVVAVYDDEDAMYDVVGFTTVTA